MHLECGTEGRQKDYASTLATHDTRYEHQDSSHARLDLKGQYQQRYYVGNGEHGASNEDGLLGSVPSVEAGWDVTNQDRSVHCELKL